MRIIVTCFLTCWGITGIKAQNVGIGTTSPVSKLTIQTTLNAPGLTHIAGTSQVIVDESIGVTSASIGTNTNHAFRIKANNNGLLHVYPGGEVVVGNNLTNSFGKLTVETLNNSYGISHLGENGNILATRMGGTSAGIGTFSNTNMRLFCNGNNAILIDAATGNIGIGTDAPSSKLHVAGDAMVTGNTTITGSATIYGDAAVTGSGEFFGTVGVGTFASPGTGVYILKDGEAIRASGNQPFITFYNGVNYKGYVWNKGADDMELGTAGVNTNGKVYLSIKGTPYLTLHSNGKVSINGGTAAFLNSSLNPALTVNGAFTLKDIANDFNEWSLNPILDMLEFKLNGTGRSYIDVDGDYNTLSDISLKDGFLPYQPVLTKIKNLNVSTYHYKSNSAGKRSFGLIAQNVAEYFPEIVSETHDKDGRKLLGVAYGKTGVLAIKAIQEQQEIIEQQQSKIESLEKRMVALEKLIEKKTK